jgi:hypothetical protein
VWSARTPTRVTAPSGSTAPPGTAVCDGYDIEVPTSRPAASNTPKVRPGVYDARRRSHWVSSTVVW